MDKLVNEGKRRRQRIVVGISGATGIIYGIRALQMGMTSREEFHHHRADDFPAYLVIVVVGHIIVPAILAVEIAYAPPTWIQLLVWLPLTLIGSLGLLQPTKGAIVGLQWQAGMHGFAASKKWRLADSEVRVQAATRAVPLTG